MATKTFFAASIREQVLRLFARGGVLIYLVALVFAFGIANSQFLSPGTLFAIISVSCPLMVVSAAMTMCLICAEVDLSVVGVVGLSSTLTALLISKNLPWPVAIAVAVVAGGATRRVAPGVSSPREPYVVFAARSKHANGSVLMPPAHRASLELPSV
jgi:rhamnose transport system permease protein